MIQEIISFTRTIKGELRPPKRIHRQTLIEHPANKVNKEKLRIIYGGKKQKKIRGEYNHFKLLIRKAQRQQEKLVKHQLQYDAKVQEEKQKKLVEERILREQQNYPSKRKLSKQIEDSNEEEDDEWKVYLNKLYKNNNEKRKISLKVLEKEAAEIYNEKESYFGSSLDDNRIKGRSLSDTDTSKQQENKDSNSGRSFSDKMKHNTYRRTFAVVDDSLPFPYDFSEKVFCDMLMRLRDVTNGVKIHKEYKYNKKKYEDCIVASEVVDWLLRNELEIVRLQRERGRLLGALYVELGIISCFPEFKEFLDEPIPFKFTNPKMTWDMALKVVKKYAKIKIILQLVNSDEKLNSFVRDFVHGVKTINLKSPVDGKNVTCFKGSDGFKYLKENYGISKTGANKLYEILSNSKFIEKFENPTNKKSTKRFGKKTKDEKGDEEIVYAILFKTNTLNNWEE